MTIDVLLFFGEFGPRNEVGVLLSTNAIVCCRISSIPYQFSRWILWAFFLWSMKPLLPLSPRPAREHEPPNLFPIHPNCLPALFECEFSHKQNPHNQTGVR